MVDKQREEAGVINVAITSDSKVRKKEHEKLEKQRELKEEREKMREMTGGGQGRSERKGLQSPKRESLRNI